MRKFSIEKLPKDVREKLLCIEWNEYDEFDEDVCGLLWLKDGYEFYDDGSTCCTFENRTDLINEIRLYVNKKEEEN